MTENVHAIQRIIDYEMEDEFLCTFCCQFLKSLGRGYLSEQSHKKKKEKKCKFLKSLGRDYLSEQSHQKKGEKVSILEKFRKRLFVRTVPPKKRRKSVNS